MGGGVSIPIHTITTAGDLEGFKLAIKKQKRKENLAQEKNDSGETPLYVAASLHHVELFEYILELYSKKHADVNEANNVGNTAFHVAAQKGYMDICQALVTASADINVTNHVSISTLCLLLYHCQSHSVLFVFLFRALYNTTEWN
jgi:ankyrin repeat protein